MRRLALAVLLTLPIAASAADTDKMVQTGTIDIDQTRVSFLVSGNGGGGTLHFKGKDYRFTIGGLGVGGIGVSKLEATGEVFNLYDRSKFPGLYSQLRTGATAADQGSGKLWLENNDGVVIHLRGKSQGLALNMGADAVNISFK